MRGHLRWVIVLDNSGPKKSRTEEGSGHKMCRGNGVGGSVGRIGDWHKEPAEVIWAALVGRNERETRNHEKKRIKWWSERDV